MLDLILFMRYQWTIFKPQVSGLGGNHSTFQATGTALVERSLSHSSTAKSLHDRLMKDLAATFSFFFVEKRLIHLMVMRNGADASAYDWCDLLVNTSWLILAHQANANKSTSMLQCRAEEGSTVVYWTLWRCRNIKNIHFLFLYRTVSIFFPFKLS